MTDFSFPATVASMDEVPADYSALYTADGETFRLIPEAADAIAQANVEGQARLAEAERNHATEIADRDATTARLQRERADRVAVRAIGDAFREADVKPGLVSAATALFRARFPIEIEKRAEGDFDAIVSDSFGRVHVADAVAAWLATDEGAPFTGPKPVPGGGMFAAEVARMKAGRTH